MYFDQESFDSFIAWWCSFIPCSPEEIEWIRNDFYRSRTHPTQIQVSCRPGAAWDASLLEVERRQLAEEGAASAALRKSRFIRAIHLMLMRFGHTASHSR